MSNKVPTYQQLRTELDAIVQQLQTGDLDIDGATQAYERGILLLKKLEQYLATAENKITKLKADFDKQDQLS